MSVDPTFPPAVAETELRPPPDPNATELYAAPSHPKTEGFTAGSTLSGNFRLENILGRGGMGEAWKAYDLTAERFVVLKFVPKEIQHIKEAIDSVRDSFKKVHALQHQHICPVYGLFTDPAHGLYLVMKFIDGAPLNEYVQRQIKKQGKMSFGDAVQILWAIAKGLDYAHEKKVIHRDIKPQNVMIGKSDGVQIIDFGLAEEIRESMAQYTGVVFTQASGTRSYMAPEQWRGRMQDARTDQYALAVTAYQLFSGRVPFSSGDADVLRTCVLNEPPEPIKGLPEHVNAALLKALSKKREDRYENCKAFVKAMATKPKAEGDIPLSVVQNLPPDQVTGITSPPVWVPSITVTSRPTKPRRQTNAWFIGVGAIAVLAVLLGLFGFFSGGPSKPEVATVNSFEPPVQSQIVKTAGADEKIPDETELSETILVRIAAPATPVLRMMQEIDSNGQVRFTTTLGMSTDPYTLKFQGEQFPFSAFPKAQAFRGKNGGGRVFFDFRDTDPEETWKNNKWNWRMNKAKVDHQRKVLAHIFGDWSRTEIDNAEGRNEEHDVHQSHGDRPFVEIGNLTLPIRVYIEVVANEKKLPSIALDSVFCYAKTTKRGGIVYSTAYAEGRLMGIGFYNIPGQDSIGIGQDDVDADQLIQREFQLPKEMLQDVEFIAWNYHCNDYGGMNVDVLLVDITATFKASAGLVVRREDDVLVVDGVNPNGSAFRSGLQKGDAIIRFNGAKRSAEQIQKILDEVQFGDPLTVAVVRNGEEKVFRFHAE